MQGGGAGMRGSMVPQHRLLCAPEDIEDLEARNGLLQFDEIQRIAAASWTDPSAVSFTAETVKHLHRCVVADIYSDAGEYRDGYVTIGGSIHEPPPPEDVSGWVDEMVAYVNEHWNEKPVHLCAYLMWRCNWIHPFSDGNGRTTRGLSYLMFLVRLGYEPGGVPTFVDQIASDKSGYYDALDLADAAYKEGRIDVSAMETLVSQLLAQQLMRIVDDAGAGGPSTPSAQGE